MLHYTPLILFPPPLRQLSVEAHFKLQEIYCPLVQKYTPTYTHSQTHSITEHFIDHYLRNLIGQLNGGIHSHWICWSLNLIGQSAPGDVFYLFYTCVCSLSVFFSMCVLVCLLRSIFFSALPESSQRWYTCSSLSLTFFTVELLSWLRMMRYCCLAIEIWSSYCFVFFWSNSHLNNDERPSTVV